MGQRIVNGGTGAAGVRSARTARGRARALVTRALAGLALAVFPAIDGPATASPPRHTPESAAPHGTPAAANASTAAPPSPSAILARRDLAAPFLDAVALCLPAELDGKLDPLAEKAAAGEWREARRSLDRARTQLEEHGEALALVDAIVAAREAVTRTEQREAERRLAGLDRERAVPGRAACVRLEHARSLLLLDRAPEAAAQLARAARVLRGDDAWSRARRAAVGFLEAEVLYRSGRRFDAHLAYRRIAREANPRLALAARLRLSDLAFDAGSKDPASLEYESLLPRGSAFGATRSGWSLRAAETALAAGDAPRAIRWIQRYQDLEPDRDARDVADIRRADLEARSGDPEAARNRLEAVAARHGTAPIGVLAGLRSVDLGVSLAPPEARIALLERATARERHGLRRYAMGVLMRELADRAALDEALAVATRLAYAGGDPALVPGYGAMLDDLLARAVGTGEAGCAAGVRALGGRYGLLIERASELAPFARLGLCFEQRDLPWLALPVYRAIGRRFGAAGTATVAMAFARSAVASGEVAVARHAAQDALSGAGADAPGWRAILAEADFRDGRPTSGLERARAVLDAPGLGLQRASLVRWIARSLAERPSTPDALFVSTRIPGWLDEATGDAGSLDRLRLLEAGLTTAHVLRRAKENDAAFALYRAVDRHAGDGPLRSSARFWLGLARQPDAAGAMAWRGEGDAALGPPWARVAAFEARYEALRDAYARVLR